MGWPFCSVLSFFSCYHNCVFIIPSQIFMFYSSDQFFINNNFEHNSPLSQCVQTAGLRFNFLQIEVTNDPVRLQVMFGQVESPEMVYFKDWNYHYKSVVIQIPMNLGFYQFTSLAKTSSPNTF